MITGTNSLLTWKHAEFLTILRHLILRYGFNFFFFFFSQPLPEKFIVKGMVERFNDDFIETRRKALHAFLNRIADHPTLTFNEDFKVFLTAQACVKNFDLYNPLGPIWLEGSTLPLFTHINQTAGSWN